MCRKRQAWFAVLMTMFLVSGCESLQRKFTRAPKSEVSRPEPVFRFKDYAEEHSAAAAYARAYTSYRLWMRELIFEIDKSGRNTRRARSSSVKTVEALEQMHALLSGEQAESFGSLLEQWKRIHERLKSKQVTRGEISLISRDANMHMREMHRRYRPSVAESFLQSQAASGES